MLLQLGIQSRRLERNAVEDTEYGEISVISIEDGLNACLSVGGCEERVQKSLAAQGELLQPGEELSGRGVVRKEANLPAPSTFARQVVVQSYRAAG